MKHHVKLYFDADHVLHLCPKDVIGSMLLSHWATDLATHGAKMLKVHTEIPIPLPAPAQ